MDNVTHTLFALTLARTRLGRVGHGATAALVIASNAPDIDFVSAARGGMSYLTWHRGPTHGLLGAVGLGLMTAAIVWAAGRRRVSRETDPPNASLRSLVALSIVGVLGHVLMDLPTSYGTRLLSPFDWRWFAADWLPIVDIYLIVALAAGLAFGRASLEARRVNTALVLVLMMTNYGVRGVAHHSALTIAPRLFGPTLPPACDGQPAATSLVDRWPRSQVTSRGDGRRCLIEMAAIPSFVSPFRWRVVARLSNAYEVYNVDLLDRRFWSAPDDSEVFWRRVLRYPNVWTPAVQRAATAPAARAFLGFSRFPVVVSAVDPAGTATVRWSDMRFTGGILPAQPAPGRQGLFDVRVRVGADGRILN
ncbi:MAG: metal-dependent hydrolase [Vicinamibacterales bacterium]